MPNSPYNMVTRARGITRTPTSRSATASDMRKKLVALCSFFSRETARMTRMFPPMVGMMTMMISRAAQFSSVPGGGGSVCVLLLSSGAAAVPDMVLRWEQQALAWVEALIFPVLDTRSAWSLGSQTQGGRWAGLGEIWIEAKPSASKGATGQTPTMFDPGLSIIPTQSEQSVRRWEGSSLSQRATTVALRSGKRRICGKEQIFPSSFCLFCLLDCMNRGRRLLFQMKSRLVLLPHEGNSICRVGKTLCLVVVKLKWLR